MEEKQPFSNANIYSSITFNKQIVMRADGYSSCDRRNEAIVERKSRKDLTERSLLLCEKLKKEEEILSLSNRCAF